MINISKFLTKIKPPLKKDFIAIGVIFAMSVVSLVILNILHLDERMAANIKILLMPVLCIPAAIITTCKFNKLNIKSQFSRPEAAPKQLVLYILVSLLILLCISFILGLLFPDSNETESIECNMGIYAITACILSPISEEILYRGVFCSEKDVFGIILAAVLFTVVHFSLINAPFYFMMALLSTNALHKFKSIYPSIIIHALSNGIMLLLMLMQ